ncbi:unnamed protein product [Chondrus crispus]|uniref:BZIP domain-containing protein n=1 Tax=Chondrus crispus TaxID=2769 RepID=R7QD28_CHOCR|nr:unnamed protein product [Chondrus crispus]CDF36407.1 unnamed protein product [Chondrus crispus]|eukprot:XP_005716226.1 unnamed protein product [Chondrus crispus]
MATPSSEDAPSLFADARLSIPEDDAAVIGDMRSGRSVGDLDVFSNLTDVKPGTIPLLVRGLNGEHSQIDVPITSTVDELSALIRPGQSSDDLRLTFGNEDLPPGASLLDTNIIDAYEHAGSLLTLIGSGGGDPAAKAAALQSACAVVETVSNGVKDMEALCAAAVDPSLHQQSPNDARTAALLREGAVEAARETPKELDASEFTMLNAILTRPGRMLPQDTVDAPQHKAATPAEVALGLSRRLPLLFPPKAAAAFAEPAGPHAHQKQDQDPALTVRVSTAAQPSIAAIREARAARRKERELRAPMEDVKIANEQAAHAVTIGNSTNGMALTDMPGRDGNLEVTNGSQMPSGGSLRMAADAKSTWLEDVMKTWEVGVVRESGVLEKTKEGQELNDYFHGLDAEAQRDIETERIEAETAEVLQKGSAQGKSSHLEGNTQEDSEEEEEANTSGDGEGGVSTCSPSDKDVHMTQFHAEGTAQSLNRPANSASNSSHTEPTSPLPSSTGTQSSRKSASSSASPQPCDSAKPIKPSTAVSPPIRQAKKIAPAPPIAMGPIGMPLNGFYPSPILPGREGDPGMGFPPLPTPPARKKRGRKRKHPELSDEERALFRKEQNRESAKLSRVRRKVIAAEYEGRLSRLLGENTHLRKEVEGLNNRLVYLQSLLTVSVRQDGNTENS